MPDLNGVYDCRDQDPLWADFLEFVNKDAHRSGVELHSPVDRLWVVFKAGAQAEHRRVVDCFKDVSINVDKVPGFEVEV